MLRRKCIILLGRIDSKDKNFCYYSELVNMLYNINIQFYSKIYLLTEGVNEEYIKRICEYIKVNSKADLIVLSSININIDDTVVIHEFDKGKDLVISPLKTRLNINEIKSYINDSKGVKVYGLPKCFETEYIEIEDFSGCDFYAVDKILDKEEFKMKYYIPYNKCEKCVKLTGCNGIPKIIKDIVY